MLQIKLILVEPKYQINLGSIARVAKNFGIDRLNIVKPRANITGHRAIMFSKHARSYLEDAKIYRSFGDSIRDCDIVVGTTGIWRKGKANFGNIYLAQEVFERINSIKRDVKVGIVIGRDDIGLLPGELERCDFIAYIGSNPQYPILNISHSIAILLYLFTNGKFSSMYEGKFGHLAEEDETKMLFKLFDRQIQGKNVRDKKAISRVFRRIIRISQPKREEIHALITALKKDTE